MNEAAAIIERPDLTPEPTKTLRDLWDNGYVWRDQFAAGADNRIVFRRIVDFAVQVGATMSEKSAAVADLTGYYLHVTGQEPENAQLERLNAWIRHGIEIPTRLYTEAELMSRIHEAPRGDYGLEMAGLDASGDMINGRVKPANEIFDIDAEQERKHIKVRY